MNLLDTIQHVKRENATTSLRALVARSIDGSVQMTPAMARSVLAEMNFPGQRKQRGSRIKKHVNRLRQGLWHKSYTLTCASFDDGRLWLIDGQHRLQAICEVGVAVDVTIIFANVANEAEARRLYAGFDEADSRRSTTEVLSAANVAEEMGLSQRIVNAVFAALPILGNDLEPLSGSAAVESNPDLFSVDRRLDLIGAWADEARSYFSAINPSTGRIRSKLHGAGCVAVGLYTFRHQPLRALEFWRAIALDDGLSRADPRKAFLMDLQERTLSTGSIRQSVQAPVLAWNAWNTGRDLKIIKCITGSPIAVWGTPFAKVRAAT